MGRTTFNNHHHHQRNCRNGAVSSLVVFVLIMNLALASAWLLLPSANFGSAGRGMGSFVNSNRFYSQQQQHNQRQHNQRHNNNLDTLVIVMMGQRGKRIRKEKRRLLQDPTPPRIATPYGPIRFNKPPRVCDVCSGRGMVRCPICQGRGVIRKTGQRKNNPIRVDRLLGSRWTSVEIRHGHRQYRVAEIKGSTTSKDKDQLELRLVNCCGEHVVTDFWIPMAELRNKMMWRMGWTTLHEIRQADGGALLDVRFCFRCKGGRIVSCLDCDGKGKIESLEPLYD